MLLKQILLEVISKCMMVIWNSKWSWANALVRYALKCCRRAFCCLVSNKVQKLECILLEFYVTKYMKRNKNEKKSLKMCCAFVYDLWNSNSDAITTVNLFFLINLLCAKTLHLSKIRSLCALQIFQEILTSHYLPPITLSLLKPCSPRTWCCHHHVFWWRSCV